MSISKTRQYVVLFSAMFFRVVSVGTGYGFSVMYAEIVRGFSVSRFKASLIQGIYTGFTRAAGLIWCDVIQKFGTGMPSVVGLFVASASLFSCAFVRQVELIILLAGAVTGIFMSISYLSSYLSVCTAFRDDPRVPLIFTSTGSSIGGFLLPLLHELFIATYFWSGAFILIAGVILQCIPSGLLIHLMLKDEENRHLKEPVARPNVCNQQLLQNYILWIILIGCLLINLTGNFEVWFIVDQLQDIGFSRQKGAILVSLLGLGNLCGRVNGSLIKFKCKHCPTLYHWLYLCPLMSAGHALVLSFQHVYSILVLVCLLHGTVFGIISSQMSSVIYETSGSENYSSAVALLNLFVGVGDIISVMFGGRSFIQNHFKPF